MRSFLTAAALVSFGLLGACNKSDAHKEHAAHEHAHAENCGHTAMKHGDQVCYEHDGHHHVMHDGHYDECTAEHK